MTSDFERSIGEDAGRRQRRAAEQGQTAIPCTDLVHCVAEGPFFLDVVEKTQLHAGVIHQIYDVHPH